MKKSLLTPIGIGFLIFCLTFCSKENYHKNIALSISEDPAFINIIESNHLFIEKIVTQITNKNITREQVLECDDKEILDFLRISDREIMEYSQNILEKIEYLENKFNISKLKEDQIEMIVREVSSYKIGFTRKAEVDPCQDQFEADFNEFHENYDNGIIYCAIISLRTGLTGLIACNALNVYRTCLAAAEAIDRYNECLVNL